MTNALPVHRAGLLVGGRAAAPAVYVRALDLAVERLEQTYTRITDETSHQRYDYNRPRLRVRQPSGLRRGWPGPRLSRSRRPGRVTRHANARTSHQVDEN